MKKILLIEKISTKAEEVTFIHHKEIQLKKI